LEYDNNLRGILFVDIPLHQDERGTLLALDRQQSVPFEIKRCFFIWGCPSPAVRAEHALSSEIALLALRGSVSIDLDNGEEQLTIKLNHPQRLLCIQAGVWLRLRSFSADSLIAAAAASEYSETSYFDAPQPALFAGADHR
jgi:hypothetical protein